MRCSARRELAFIALLGLAVRVVVVLATPAYVPATDAFDFDRNALSLAQTGHFPVASVLTLQGGPTAFRPPAFSVLLSLVYRITGTADAHTRWEGGRLMEAALGAITVMLIWWLARRTFGPRVATLAAAIAAIYPPLILVGSSLLSESLFIPLVLAAVLAALEARRATSAGRARRGLGLCVLAGVLTAAAALARSNGIVIVIALAGIVWIPSHRSVGPVLSSLVAPAVLVLALAVALVPWTVRNEHVFHALVPTTTETGYALAGVYNPAVQSGAGPHPGFWFPPVAAMEAIQRADPTIDEAQMNRRLTAESVDYIEAHPFSVVRESWWSLPRLLGFSGPGFERYIAQLEAYPPTLAVISIYSFWLVGLLALGASVVLIRRHGPRRRTDPGSGYRGLALWLCPVLLFLSTLPVIGDARYRSPCDPFVLVLAAVAVLELSQVLARRRARVRPLSLAR